MFFKDKDAKFDISKMKNRPSKDLIRRYEDREREIQIEREKEAKERQKQLWRQKKDAKLAKKY